MEEKKSGWAAVHRDDLPMDVAADIVTELQALHPGCNIVFAGDAPGGVPPELQTKIDLIMAATEWALMRGLCFDCGANIPLDWPPTEGVRLPEGWAVFRQPNGDPAMLQCPDCDAKEQASGSPPRLLEVPQWIVDKVTEESDDQDLLPE
jgi:hypothetical protein